MIKLTDKIVSEHSEKWAGIEENLKAVIFKLMLYEDTGLNPDDIELLKESNRWIPVSKSVPMTSDFVLVFVKTADDGNVHFRDTFCIGSYDDESGWLLEEHPTAENINVTHWKPLSAPLGVE